MTPHKAALNLTDIHRSFSQGGEILEVLKGVSIDLEPGTTTALVGTSGSGKSTLLHIAGLLDRPSSGTVILSGQDVTGLKESEKALLRQSHIGFVYQFHHLLPEFSALENVMMPLLIQGIPPKDAKERAGALMEKLSLSHRASHRPSRLSGGEQQRIAILRALVTNPKVLLADEPTGNLDVETSSHVFQELQNLVKEEKIAALIATHDPELAAKMDHKVQMVGGLLQAS